MKSVCLISVKQTLFLCRPEDSTNCSETGRLRRSKLRDNTYLDGIACRFCLMSSGPSLPAILLLCRHRHPKHLVPSPNCRYVLTTRWFHWVLWCLKFNAFILSLMSWRLDALTPRCSITLDIEDDVPRWTRAYISRVDVHAQFQFLSSLVQAIQ